VARRGNPPWEYDELILALDLYRREGQVGDTHPEVVELSRVLNLLPIHQDRGSYGTFRNPNGVAMKLGNFARFDPDYSGVGLQRGGQREEEVWDHYATDPDDLRRAAQEIRSRVEDGEVPPESEEDEDQVVEGRVLFRVHRARERNRALVRKKKSKVKAETGRLACEVCDVDFGERYGELGDGFIECHHRLPLSKASGRRRTYLSDLALVCPNCHRMLHRSGPFITVEDLRDRMYRGVP